MLHEDFPPGAPCRVATHQPDPSAAADFYRRLFGWRIDAHGTAWLRNRRVAHVGHGPEAVWTVYVRVGDIADAVGRVTAAGGSRIADDIVADPTGVVFGLTTGPVAGVTGAPGAWAMCALHSPDLDAASAFYGSMFGWRLEPMPDAPLSLWRLPGHVGREPGSPLPQDVVGVATPATAGIPPHWAINFSVSDADATAETALALGGRLLLEPTDSRGLRNAAIADPQGGVIAVSPSI